MFLRFLVLVLGGLLVFGRTLTYASPLDPAWLGGFWEDDDYDDAVYQTMSFGAAETAPICTLRPHWTPVWIIAPDDEQLAPGLAILPQHPRGPPLV